MSSRPKGVERVRGEVAEAIRSRIGGDDRVERERRIWFAPGERWFGPDDPVWRVHKDTSMLVGGLRALVVQSLHPLAMAGVDQHSGYRGDPWGRLQRTSLFIATTTYAPARDAEAMIRAIRTIHEGVTGTDERGRAYAAGDPHLLAWVHAAECESFLVAHQAYGAEPLSPTDADTYVAQMGSISERLGFADAPHTVAELEGVLAAYRPELEGTPAAVRTVRYVLDEPDLPVAARPAYVGLAAAALAVTPGWAREMLGLDRSRWRTAPALGRPVGRATTAAMRWAIDHPADSQVCADALAAWPPSRGDTRG